MIQVVENEIDTDAVLQSVADENAGANLLFLGTTRRWTGELETKKLHYECYAGMAEKDGNRWDGFLCSGASVEAGE